MRKKHPSPHDDSYDANANNRRFAKRKLKCNCFRPGTTDRHWLFSRYSTGWKCGLHPDWTELTACVDRKLDVMEGPEERSRRYFYVTFLREPISR